MLLTYIQMDNQLKHGWETTFAGLFTIGKYGQEAMFPGSLTVP